MTSTWFFIGGAVLCWASRACFLLRRRSGGIARWGWLGAAAVVGLSGLLLELAGAVLYWYAHRSQPAPVNEPIFKGIAHICEVRQSPRPIVIHVAKIDLRAPGISFLVTPGEPTGGRGIKARKTTTFLREFGVQLAMNANYFFPFRTESPWDYYPHEGDPVDVCGFAASRGNVYSNKEWVPGVLYLSEKNEASFDEPIGEVYNAISGNGFLVRSGKSKQPFKEDFPYPRAGLGLDRDRRHLLLFIIDGKQPNYSEGASLSELAAVMVEHGVWDGIRIDEGGSATLAKQGSDGKPQILNSPINHRIPHLERVVANHIGVYAREK